MSAEEQFEAFRAEVIKARDESWAKLDASRFPMLESLPSEIIKCDQLEELNLGKTSVSKLDLILNLEALFMLDLSWTHLEDLHGLGHLKKLEFLYLSQNPIMDISEISVCPSLISVDLNGTRVRDISPLLSLGKIEKLILRGAPVDDLKVLSEKSHLAMLDLVGTEVLDLRPIRNCELRGSTGIEFEEGLEFHGCLATKLDPQLEELSHIKDHYERTGRTLHYLRNLNDAVYDSFLARRRMELGLNAKEEVVQTNAASEPSSTPPPAKIRTALQQSYPDLRDRAQYLVALLQDEQAQHKLMPVPNSDEALEEYQAKARFLDEMLAGVIALHEALPEQMPDLDDSTVLDLRARLVKIAEVANRGITYLDQHEGTYGSLWKLGVVSAVGGLIALVPGVNFLAGAGLAGAAVLAQTVKVTVKRAR